MVEPRRILFFGDGICYMPQQSEDVLKASEAARSSLVELPWRNSEQKDAQK